MPVVTLLEVSFASYYEDIQQEVLYTDKCKLFLEMIMILSFFDMENPKIAHIVDKFHSSFNSLAPE